jgi:hypothetical protein
MANFISNTAYLLENHGLDDVGWLNNDIQAMFNKIFRTNAPRATENLTIHVKVKDYSTWRPAYDAHEKSRLSAGITNGRVFRSAEDPNDVVILQDVADVAKARTWLGSDEMKATMQNGSPNVRFAAAA